MNVTLSDEMKKFIASELKAGRYGKPSDVVRAAMQSLMQQSVPPFGPGEHSWPKGSKASQNMARLVVKHPLRAAEG